jgi:phytoene dehydrogenase-like protein
MTVHRCDAVVIGAGPNGLTAANLLADAGWDVVVLEANDTIGGAVRTEDLTAPGFHHDVFSAFYPFGVASPVFRQLRLEDWGLTWTHAPHVLAHPRRSGPAAVLSRDLEVTAASLDDDHPGDGDAYRQLDASWRAVSEPLLDALLKPLPPIRPALRLAARQRVRGMSELARLSLLSVRRLGEESFGGEAGRLLFAGNALHADLPPEGAGSALMGSMLVGIGQQLGFPVPVGGAARIPAALAVRAHSRGVQIVSGAPATAITVSGGRATGVTTATGETYLAERAVLASCDVTAMARLVGEDHLPARYRAALGRVQRAAATVKVDWALSAPVPWNDSAVSNAGTVHIAESLDELTMTMAEIAASRIPARPFLVMGQMTTADPTRSPPGTEALWAYTHVPQHAQADAGGEGIRGVWDESDQLRFADRMEQRIEELAPGFRDRVIARCILAPGDLQARDANLVGGDISGGTAQLHQQLVLRPVPGLGRPTTPVADLYLASASAHPGGGVHGACGANAARAALLDDLRRPGGRARRTLAFVRTRIR